MNISLTINIVNKIKHCHYLYNFDIFVESIWFSNIFRKSIVHVYLSTKYFFSLFFFFFLFFHSSDNLCQMYSCHKNVRYSIKFYFMKFPFMMRLKFHFMIHHILLFPKITNMSYVCFPFIIMLVDCCFVVW